MSKKCIRFGVRTESRSSSTWKIFVRGDDVYLVCRPLGAAMKTSLHASGSWHFGFIRTFAHEHFEEGDPKRDNPYVAIWPRPPEIAPGVTVAFRLLFPHSGLHVPLSHNSAEKIVWIAADQQGACTEVDIVFTSAEALVSSWPGARSEKTQLVGRLDIARGDHVWVVHRVVEVPDIAPPAGHGRLLKGRSYDELTGDSLRALAFGSSEDGSHWILETAVEPGSA